jgi:hypothetical protein
MKLHAWKYNLSSDVKLTTDSVIDLSYYSYIGDVELEITPPKKKVKKWIPVHKLESRSWPELAPIMYLKKEDAVTHGENTGAIGLAEIEVEE